MRAWITSELAGRAAKAHAPPSERERPQQWYDRVQSEKSRRSVAAAARRNEGEVETSPQAYAAARVFFGVASALVPGGWVVRGLAAANAADEVSTGLRQFRDPEAKSVKARSGEAAARALGASESTARSVGAAADVLVPVGIGIASVVGVALRAASASFGRAIGSAVDDAFAGTAQAVDDLAPRVSTAAKGGGDPRTLYHYTADAEESFGRGGLWSGSSVTDDATLTAQEAIEQLGVRRAPDKVIRIVDRGHFVPNRPHIVEPHPLGGGAGRTSRILGRFRRRTFFRHSQCEGGSRHGRSFQGSPRPRMARRRNYALRARQDDVAGNDRVIEDRRDVPRRHEEPPGEIAENR